MSDDRRTKSVKAAAKPSSARQRPLSARDKAKEIEPYYRPTPNGWKISVMLEECGLPYTVKPVNIGIGDRFKRSFLKIAPSNRMPAIVDPIGPGGKPTSIFESGAIVQYLGRKTEKVYSARERSRAEVDQWLFWQMAGLGPMTGQAHHFRQYVREKIPYAIKRYINEVNRLYGVMNKRLKDRDYLAGRYAIADMACRGWIVPYKNQGRQLDDFPFLKDWFAQVGARPAVKRGFALGREWRRGIIGDKTKEAERAPKILFGQRARQ